MYGETSLSRSTLGQQGGLAAIDTPVQPQDLDRIANRLGTVGAQLLAVDQRLLTVADRLFGSIPTGTGSTDKSAGIPTAAIPALDAYINNINDLLERVAGTITRLERA